MAAEYDFLFKVLITGDTCVGKSCLLLRYADDTFKDSTLPTIGVDFKIRTIDVDSKTIKLQLWDTAGQERFKTITSTYYRSAQGIMIVYDVTNQDSFANIQRQWLPEIQRYASSNVSLVLVGNKSDLSNKRVISTEEGKALADTLGVSFVETSARTATQVEAAFTMISAEIMERLEKDFLNTSKRQVQYPSPTVSLSRNGKQTSGCCFSA